MDWEKTFFENFDEYVDKYGGYEIRPLEDLFQEIQDKTKHFDTKGKDLIRRAYEMGKQAHIWQKRKTGWQFFTHPLTIVCMMLPYSPDAELIAAALLHDTIEDTWITSGDIEVLSPTVTTLVEWLTKIWYEDRENNATWLTSEEEKFETIRKVLTASQRDIRILFLKIFDRLHNMVTITGKNPESQKRIAEETRNIYVPLAKRCWLREVYHQLKALCMQILEPEKWSTIKTFVTQKSEEMRQESAELQAYFQEQIWSTKNLEFCMEFLSPFSVDSSKYFNDYAWYANQIVVPETLDCYSILQNIGQRGDINCIQAGKISDFINNPRFSGYSWVHSEVIFRGYKRMKIRIITKKTKEKEIIRKTFQELSTIYSSVLFRDFDLINEATISNSEAFMESVTAHVFARKIPLHSQVNPLFYMPNGLTMLDAVIYLEPNRFAYIESIYRNDEKSPFYALLKNDDIITYTFWEKITLTERSKNDINSGISRWRLEKLFG